VGGIGRGSALLINAVGGGDGKKSTTMNVGAAVGGASSLGGHVGARVVVGASVCGGGEGLPVEDGSWSRRLRSFSANSPAETTALTAAIGKAVLRNAAGFIAESICVFCVVFLAH
jgi:hypothetical protein